MTAGGRDVDDVHELPLPPSIYFGGCAFGAAFCKSRRDAA